MHNALSCSPQGVFFDLWAPAARPILIDTWNPQLSTATAISANADFDIRPGIALGLTIDMWDGLREWQLKGGLGLDSARGTLLLKHRM